MLQETDIILLIHYKFYCRTLWYVTTTESDRSLKVCICMKIFSSMGYFFPNLERCPRTQHLVRREYFSSSGVITDCISTLKLLNNQSSCGISKHIWLVIYNTNKVTEWWSYIFTAIRERKQIIFLFLPFDHQMVRWSGYHTIQY